MSQFDGSDFIRFIIDNRVVGFFDEPVTLKSGRKSNWYVNWRTVTSDVFLTDMLSDYLLSFAQSLNLDADAFYGVPEGATKLGIIATYKFAKLKSGYAAGSNPLPMGRGKPKEHGAPQDKFFVGEPRGRVIVVEDVTTTGGSLITALEALSQVDVKVVAAIGLTNRMEKRDDGTGVEEAIKKRGVPYFALSCATDFLPAAVRAFNPSEKIKNGIAEEFKQYGLRPLKL